jgi:effector-binding domain-containing protein/carbon monoxide dehydrogenase subunit G
MLRNILLGLVLVVAVFFAIGLVLPDTVHVERSVKINAPQSQVFALVNGFRQFDKWSPWADRDPQMKVQLSGPAYGVGAHYEWSGNKAVGSGTQEIVASTAYSQVKTRLTFAGFERASMASFNIEPDDALTRVTWGLDIKLGGNPIGHYFGLLMDRQIGPDYERGLARLKALAEGGDKTDLSALKVDLVDGKAQAYAYVSGSTSTDADAIAKALAAAYAKVGVFLQASGLKQAGAPLSVTRRWDAQAKVYEFDAGIPVDRADAQAPATLQGKPNEVKIAQTYAGAALKVEHHGSYKEMGKTYELIDAFKKAYALQDNGLSWEQYVSDPGKTPEAQLLTDIYVPVK